MPASGPVALPRGRADPPDLASDVKAARGTSLGLPATPKPTAEKQALEATRQLLKSRTSTLVVAMIVTVLPLTFVFRGTTITFLLIRDAPIIGIAARSDRCRRAGADEDRRRAVSQSQPQVDGRG